MPFTHTVKRSIYIDFRDAVGEAVSDPGHGVASAQYNVVRDI